MKIPKWKQLLSYLIELPIEKSSSQHNPYLEVTLKKGRFQLSTANAVYSYADLYDNFSDAFHKINLDKRPIKRVLILGFGLGSIPIVLEKKFNKQYDYTAVEIDEEVLFLANKYALPEIESRIEMICADAYSFVMQCHEVFDMINVDLFLDDTVPSQFEADDFLQQLQRLLKKDGILLYNRLAFTQSDVENAKDFYENNFHPNFPDGGYLEVRGNWMLVNKKDLIE